MVQHLSRVFFSPIFRTIVLEITNILLRKLDADFNLHLPLDRPPNREEHEQARRRQQIADTRKMFEDWREKMLLQLNTSYRVGHLALKDKHPDVWTNAEVLAVRWRPALEDWSNTLDYGSMDEQMEIFRDRKGVERLCQTAVAESPIDALSLATLVKRSGGDWRDSFYLSLGGTADRAMMQFLRDHPQITQVSLCLDNDGAGMKGMERMEQAIREDPELSGRVKLIHQNPPPLEYGKDFNEFLIYRVKADRAKNVPVRDGR